MSDLIDKDDTLKIIADTVSLYGTGTKVESEILSIVSKIPSAEPKKGRWIFARYFVWECSECGKSPTKGMGFTKRKDELFRYCPNCGAKMEEE